MSPPSRSNFRERLGTYLLGIAIGLCILGLIYMGRYRAMQRQRAAQQQAAPANPAPAPAPAAGPPSKIK